MMYFLSRFKLINRKKINDAIHLNLSIIENKDDFMKSSVRKSNVFPEILKKYKIVFVIFVIIIAFSIPRIIEGFTTPEVLLNKYLHDKYSSIKIKVITEDVLTDFLLENSKYKFSGAICNDGWISHSQGRGTCSHHGGVAYYFYEGNYSKSIDECKKQAKTLIDELLEKAVSKSWIE